MNDPCKSMEQIYEHLNDAESELQRLEDDPDNSVARIMIPYYRKRIAGLKSARTRILRSL